MPGLRLYSSNRLEVLAQGLAQVLEYPLSAPLSPEIIVVQSRGMERWLTLKLTDHLGVLANCRFPFPHAFLQELFTTVLDTGEDQAFLKEHMAFKLMGLLAEPHDAQAFASIRQYLSDDPTGLKRYTLARNLADAFDQYLIFRPRMVLAWEDHRAMYGGDSAATHLESWQAMLWRSLNTPAKPHRAYLSQALLAALDRTEGYPLPERISIFGISYLPPFFIEIFEALARHMDVHLFLMNPCREYWAHIQGLRAQERMAARYQAAVVDLHLEEGNTLLAGLGSQGKYFIDRVCAADDVQIVDDYREPASKSMLAQVQTDILTLIEPENKRPVAAGDTSIQVHACHSPMREVEVLYDHLLNLFQNRPDLTPEEILVMAPAIETYAPYIEAVFGYAGDERERIPFSIADRPAGRQPAIETMLALLESAEGRMPSDTIMSLLEVPAIRARFGIVGDNLALVRDWIVKTRIRWAYDGPDKASLGLPSEGANTWRAGLDRMLLGFCMPGDAKEPWNRILPYGQIEGEDALLLGHLCEFIEHLHAWMQACAAEQPPVAWAALLAKGLSTFCDPDLAQGHQEFRAGLDRLSSAPFDGPVSLQVVRAWLSDHFRYPSEHGFLAGGVTCCSLLPMRSIPFKVICLLGLDNDTFPRQQTRKGFDLMTLKPQRGDRSRRDDDRYLFLEALVSARETLYLSYVGQDQQDNSIRPPSVLISELLDYLEKTFVAPHLPPLFPPSGGKRAKGFAKLPLREAISPLGPPEGGKGVGGWEGDSISAFVTRVHRLHGFSSSYFSGDGRLFSYSSTQARTAMALEQGRIGEVRRFITAGLDAGLGQWRELDVETLVKFFQHPVRFFLEQRLGMRLPQDEAELMNRETFDLKGLDRYAAGERIIAARLSGQDPLPILVAEGMLPHGPAGLYVYTRLSEDMESLVQSIGRFACGTVEARPVDLMCAGYHITGSVAAYPEGLLLYRAGKVRPKDLVGMWVRHVVLNAQDRMTSCAIGCDFDMGRARIQEVRLTPLDGAALLPMLLELFTQGLKRPLAFYPESAYAFAQAETQGNDGLREAAKVWEGSDQKQGEGTDGVYHFHPGQADPFPPEFTEIAHAFFGPLLQALEGEV